MAEIVLVRYGEVGLKGENRSFFEKALVRNIQRALSGINGVDIRREYGRLFVEHAGAASEVVERLSRVFGIVSISPAVAVPLDLDSISDAALELARTALVEGGTFKVETRRSNKSFPFRSPEVCSMIGGRILEEIPGIAVDVHEPDFRLRIEIRDKEAFVFSSAHAGPGGLPVGVSGRGALMLSGGIDSPVAGWLAMKRGVKLVAVHFFSPPFTSERSKEKVIDLCRELARFGGKFPLQVVPFTKIQKAIKTECPDEFYVTIMRRMMLRVVERICEQQDCAAVFTGENLAQVASQTLQSMTVIENAVGLPILRPLITYDKTEIIRFAREIGTYDISIRPYEDCCTLFVPKHPATKPKLERVIKAESRLPDISAMVGEAVESTEVINIS